MIPAADYTRFSPQKRKKPVTGFEHRIPASMFQSKSVRPLLHENINLRSQRFK